MRQEVRPAAAPKDLTPFLLLFALCFLVYANSLGAFSQALRRDAGSFETYDNLGMVYANLNRLEEAGQAYTRALSLRPDYEPAKRHLERLQTGLKVRRRV